MNALSRKGHHDAGRLHRQMEFLGAQGAFRGAGALHRSVPLARRAEAAEGDPTGERYCFERGVRKDTGGDGWADVWKRHHFAWEYKGKHADLDAAFNQLRQYALALENPPLLVVSDMARFRIRTNWTNSVSQTQEFALARIIRQGTAPCRNRL